jgi:hypothetical protein
LQHFVGLNVGVQTKQILTAGSLVAAFNRRQGSEALQKRCKGENLAFAAIYATASLPRLSYRRRAVDGSLHIR